MFADSRLSVLPDADPFSEDSVYELSLKGKSVMEGINLSISTGNPNAPSQRNFLLRR